MTGGRREPAEAPGAEDAAGRLTTGRLETAPPVWALNRRDIAEALVTRPGRLRLALTGGAAAGKSVVSGLFAALGAREIDLDRLARRASAPGTPGLTAALELLGRDCLGPDGALDRARAGRAVFADPELRAGLEAVLHPLIWDLLGRELAALAEAEAVVISVPLLFEAGLETFFRPIVVVFADRERQLERLTLRDPGLGRAGAERLLAAQWPAPPKLRGADFVIRNNGGLDETERQVRAVWGALSAT